MASYFDTHTHLNFAVFQDKVVAELAQARSAGVEQVVIVATDLENARRAVELAQANQGAYAAVGVHPHHLFDHFRRQHSPAEVVSQLVELVRQPEVVAVGEIGLDRWHYPRTRYVDYQVSETFVDFQASCLQAQLELALEAKKAVVLHNRQASARLLTELTTFLNHHPAAAAAWRHRVVFHCTEPDLDILQFAQDHDWYLGVTGDISYDLTKQKFLRQLPLELMVLETDSPFLRPRPLTGTCHSADLPLIAQLVADLTGHPIEHIAAVTLANSNKLFNVTQGN